MQEHSVTEDLQRFRVIEWFEVKGDSTLRVDYPLTNNSVVFDVGGYEGNWAAEIFEKYKCFVYVFEPVPQFYERIKERFASQPQIKVYNFGLGSRSESLEFRLDSDGTSLFGAQRSESSTIRGNIENFTEFMRKEGVTRIDLIKINIEGGEFDLVPEILNSEFRNSVDNLQIQFHSFVPAAVEKMEAIQTNLRKTHVPTYSFDFVWENWKLIDGNAELIPKTLDQYFKRTVQLDRTIVALRHDLEKSESTIRDLGKQVEQLHLAIDRIRANPFIKFGLTIKDLVRRRP